MLNPGNIDKPLLMGILNVTPDSFSDGGESFDQDAAVQHALKMVDEGVDILDIGAESTRPGADRISADEQKQRIMPILYRLQDVLAKHVSISIDTTLAEVADAALQAGAGVINDVTAGRDDEGIFTLAADRNVPLILMHMQGTPATMQVEPQYDDVVEEIRAFLLQRAALAEASGVKKENIIIDPGIGFGKSKQHNLELMANLHRFVETDYTVLLGTSRKRFMGNICDVEQFNELVGATCATTSLGAMAGVKIFRVHDVKANRQALDVTMAIQNAKYRDSET